MNITFFIGNGFDINLGLKTKYSNFYPYFLSHANENNMIKKWINGNEMLWADLEEKLGQELQKVEPEKILQFYADKEELDSLLIEYLEKEQNKYSCGEKKEIIIQEFIRSMLNFKMGLPINDVNSINLTLETYKDETHTYSFISFNYTNTLDNIIKTAKEKNATIATHQSNYGKIGNYIGTVLHIHGTTDEEMILGVNDIEQIKNEDYKQNEEFLDTFIKIRMNNSIGQRKVEKAKEVISNSHIICIFGMSLGNTDKIWWEELINWLLSSKNNKLIIFWKGFEEILKKKLPSKTIRLNNEIKNMFLAKGRGKHSEQELENIKNRVMISYNADIFNFPKVNEEVENSETIE